MAWRGPRVEREQPTLGWLVYDWIVANCVIPDGDFAGDPFVPSVAQTDFLLAFYQLHPDADVRVQEDVRERPSRAFAYSRGGLLVQPQGSGKSPFAAAIALAEAAGPVRFDGWDASGEPVGRPWATPLVAITAQSEDQAKNVWDALLPMVERSDSTLRADVFSDIGVTRINLPNGGQILPVTASSKSRQGARATFVVQDEVQGWDVMNKGVKLADTQYRSLAKMGGRFMQICNAWDPAEESVGQQTWETGLNVYKQMSEPGPGSIKNQSDLDRMLRRVYTGSEHVDLERIKDDIDNYLKRNETANAERYFLNRIVPGEDYAFDRIRWAELEKAGYRPESKSSIVIGVDGARYRDALALVACEISTGFIWPLRIFERPDGAPDDYEHSFDEADGVLADAMNDFDVWRVYIDPGSQYANISPLVERWSARYGSKRILEWIMARPKPTCIAVRNFASAIMTGDLSHDGDETLTRHIGYARRYEMNVYDDDGHKMHSVKKEHPTSPKKIDGAAAAIIAWEARGDALEAGVTNVSTYDDPVNKCETCGHLRRHHTPECRGRPEGHCKAFVEPRREDT